MSFINCEAQKLQNVITLQKGKPPEQQHLKTGLMQDLLTGKKRVTALMDDMGVTN